MTARFGRRIQLATITLAAAICATPAAAVPFTGADRAPQVTTQRAGTIVVAEQKKRAKKQQQNQQQNQRQSAPPAGGREERGS